MTEARRSTATEARAAVPGGNPDRVAATLTRITGTLAEARPLRDAALYELVRVGERGLIGEIIRFTGDTATLQIFEDTTGLAVGAPVVTTDASLTAELGPGLLGSVLDGIGRPLARLADATGDFIAPGAVAPTLDRARRWQFAARARPGDRVAPGDVLGVVEEHAGFEHSVLVPPGITGVIAAIGDAELTVDDAVGTLVDGTPLRLAQRWPIRTPRPAAQHLATDRPFVTGQRIFDLLFPLAEGGTVAVPGGFGTGKTIVEHSLAKYAAADLVVFVGCGERGNEMAELLEDFPRLVDPRTGRPVMERTVLVVNTSNMPVVAREASVYLGVTIAEYYRDMGHRVAVMVDSLSRWAEALRDIGARLQEMPGEEGYPTYMASRLGALYERAGRTRCLGSPERTGAVTLVCAVSPPGGDFSEPVTQASLRVAGGLWALDAQLARARQFPAVDWATSYSLYADAVVPALAAESGAAWATLRTRILALLQRDAELREIASLVGNDEMEDRDRLVLAIASLVREHVLGQNAFHPDDATSPLAKTAKLAELAIAALDTADAALAAGAELDALPLAAFRRAVAAFRNAPADARDARIADALRALEGLR
jgi:V/A-type H+-transporting ATPase subunit A